MPVLQLLQVSHELWTGPYFFVGGYAWQKNDIVFYRTRPEKKFAFMPCLQLIPPSLTVVGGDGGVIQEELSGGVEVVCSHEKYSMISNAGVYVLTSYSNSRARLS